MTFCMKCGTEVPDEAEFCPKCGKQVAGLVKTEKTDHSGTGGTLMLIGGILSVVLSIFTVIGMLLLLPFRSMRGWMEISGMWEGGGIGGWEQWGIPWMMDVWRFIMGFMMVGALISVVLGIIAIYAYKRVRSDDVKSGGTIGIIIGVIMLLTMNWLSGIITLIGGILCYTSK